MSKSEITNRNAPTFCKERLKKNYKKKINNNNNSPNKNGNSVFAINAKCCAFAAAASMTEMAVQYTIPKTNSKNGAFFSMK